MCWQGCAVLLPCDPLARWRQHASPSYVVPVRKRKVERREVKRLKKRREEEGDEEVEDQCNFHFSSQHSDK
tara:strand:+ start:73 stop:285 length:213 start_codon:yes stop_codon:yes gene_type:complete